ncbi:MAG TPA: metal ABC transporter permease [Pseudonocardia sp.]|jgi:zinc/manganese transport system permease protein|nr:metal ABC transporter permease [Pseudonocardia sp.]
MINSLLALLAHDYLRHALVAGTAIALLSGLVGYFVVLRGQTFVGDMLSHVAYTGAIAALAFGLDPRLGLFAATLALAVGVGLLGGRASADDVIIGNAMAWVLGLGVFFLAIYTGTRASGNSGANVAVLFGSIFGISAQVASLASWIAVGLILVLLVIARPLMFASLDPSVAAASGVPTRLLGPLFLAVVGATAAEATQAVGALLLVGLLAAPPAAARYLTDRPWVALWLSGALAVAAMWIGLAVAYLVPTLPPSFTIMAAAAAEYTLAALAGTARAWGTQRLVTARMSPRGT